MAFRRLSKDNLSVSKYYKMNAPEIPHPKVVVWEVGHRIEGKYVDKRVNGEFVSYILELANGDLVSVPKTSAIESALSEIAKGSLIALTNEGKMKLKSGKTFNRICIEIDDAAAEEASSDDGEESDDDSM